MDCNRFRAMTGIWTLSWNVPDAPAHAMAASLPITCVHTCSTASGTTGLTLPGMIDDPGCRSARWISASPAAGPEPSRRRSLHTFVSDTATTRS